MTVTKVDMLKGPTSQAPESKVPAFPEKHTAKAGAPPNAVTMPAAIASPRKAPPAMALAPMRRARKLMEMPVDAPATATSWTRRVALILLVFMVAPRAKE
jgi:hypothetical protein